MKRDDMALPTHPTRAELVGIPELHAIEICAGVGMLGEGLRAGLAHLGATLRTVAYLEREAYAAACLAARIEEGSLDSAPIWSDLLTFNGRAFRGGVDCIAAGFPCQDLSLAGKRAGLDGKRSGLFFDILDIADASGAWSLFLENVAGIASATASVVDEAEGDLEERAAARVLGELADRGWHAEWLTLPASEVGASHGRERWFCFAWRQPVDDAAGPGPQERGCSGERQLSAQIGTGLLNRPEQPSEQLGHPDGQRCRETRPSDPPAPHARPGGAIASLANPTGNGWQQGRAEPSGQQGRSDAAECGGAMANAERPNIERPREPGNMACESGQNQSGNRSQQRPSLDGGGCAMAHTCSERQQGRELPRALHGNRGGWQAHGSTEQLRRPLFAPGPSSPDWASIIAHQPWLAPALSTEEQHTAGAAFAAAFPAPQPDVCGEPDGLAPRLDFETRAQRLKCGGNGVVALQAATAFVLLARRSGIF